MCKTHITLAVGTTHSSCRIPLFDGKRGALAGDRVGAQSSIRTPSTPLLWLHQSLPDLKLSEMGEETHPVAWNREMPGDAGGGTHPQRGMG